MLNIINYALHFMKKIIRRTKLYSYYNLLRSNSALKKYGWFKSVSEEIPIDAQGNPLPWLTYPAVNFIRNRISNNFKIFEYGCGNSTLWWASRVTIVYSCEHDERWYRTMKNSIPQNVFLNYIKLNSDGNYAKEISKYNNEFDVIVIDGRDRVKCIKNCLISLNDQGIIILDNSEREAYEEGINYLLNNGFKRIDFEGMGPVNCYSWCTTIFYREDNCFGI